MCMKVHNKNRKKSVRNEGAVGSNPISGTIFRHFSNFEVTLLPHPNKEFFLNYFRWSLKN